MAAVPNMYQNLIPATAPGHTDGTFPGLPPKVPGSTTSGPAVHGHVPAVGGQY